MAGTEYCLKLTPEQRLEEHDFALNIALQIKAPDSPLNGYFILQEAKSSNE